MEAPFEWLLEGAPYIRYRTRRDLLGLPEDDPQVAADRAAMLADPLVEGGYLRMVNHCGANV